MYFEIIRGTVVIVLELQLPVQSVPITTKVVSSNSVHDELYQIQHYVIKFVSDLRQVGGFNFSTNKTDRHDITEIFFKVALNTINQPSNNRFEGLPGYLTGLKSKSVLSYVLFLLFQKRYSCNGLKKKWILQDIYRIRNSNIWNPIVSCHNIVYVVPERQCCYTHFCICTFPNISRRSGSLSEP